MKCLIICFFVIPSYHFTDQYILTNLKWFLTLPYECNLMSRLFAFIGSQPNSIKEVFFSAPPFLEWYYDIYADFCNLSSHISCSGSFVHS